MSHFNINFFQRVVWMLSQLTAFVLKLPQKNLDGKKSTVRKTVIIPQYLLARMLSIIFSCGFFSIFNKYDGGFYWNGLSIFVFTNIMNNCVQLKKIEPWLLVLFLLIILEMHSSVAMECAACVCFFKKLWVWKKICSNL